jgi:Tfp pilus assembly protein PilF
MRTLVGVQGMSERSTPPALILAAAALVFLGAACAKGGASQSRKGPEEEGRQKYHWALEQYRRGNYLEALQSIEQAIERDEDEYAYYNLRGLIHRSAGELDAALSDFTHVLTLNPYFTDAHNNLGATYAELGRSDEAMAEFQLVLKDPMYPHKEKAHANAGDLLFNEREFEKAIEHYQQAVIAKPDYYRAHFKLGKSYLALGKTEAARGSFNEVIRIAPQSTEAREAKLILQGDVSS